MRFLVLSVAPRRGHERAGDDEPVLHKDVMQKLADDGGKVPDDRRF